MKEAEKDSTRRFYVYHHICNCDFEISSVKYSKGDVVYVGSGTGRRFKELNKKKRTKKHTPFFDKITPVIVHDNLTLEEKYDLEQFEIDKYWDSGILINESKVVRRPKKISYEYLSQFLEVDESSPSKLIWRNPTCTKNKPGDSAGYINSLNGYWYVSLCGTQYRVNRVVYCLYNRMDVADDLVIDHIDKDNRNNHPSNLRMVSNSLNNVNRNFNTAKREGVTGVRWCDRSKHWRAYINIDHSQVVKIFTVNKLFPNVDFDKAKDLSFRLALDWRKEMESLYYDF